MAVCMSGGSEENVRRLLSFDIAIMALNMAWWFMQTLGTSTTLVRVVGNLEMGTFLTCYIKWLFLVFEACLTPFSNKIMQNHILHVVLWPSSIRSVFDCSTGLNGLQTCHRMNTSGHGLLRDWNATLFQLIW